MSCNYADNLSHYEHKGKLGLPEKFDSAQVVEEKSLQLAEWLKASKHTVVHSGAGISTSAGIPDFRGPNGVWTLEKEGKKPTINMSWDDAKPTVTHMALLTLQNAGYVSYIITQNVDGLHLRAGTERKFISELHGNLFIDKCNPCQRQFVRHGAVETVGQKTQGVSCPGRKLNKRKCRGKLYDNILDWEDSLPDADLELAHMHSCIADLSLCLGTTLQIVPSGNLPVHTKKRGGKLVICNLQPTKQDRHADLIINSYVDDVMLKVLKILEIPIIEYDKDLDPVVRMRKMLLDLKSNIFDCVEKKDVVFEFPDKFEPIEWTIPESWVKDKDLIYKAKSKKVIKAKRKESSDVEDKNAININKKIKDEADLIKCKKSSKLCLAVKNENCITLQMPINNFNNEVEKIECEFSKIDEKSHPFLVNNTSTNLTKIEKVESSET